MLMDNLFYTCFATLALNHIHLQMNEKQRVQSCAAFFILKIKWNYRYKSIRARFISAQWKVILVTAQPAYQCSFSLMKQLTMVQKKIRHQSPSDRLATFLLGELHAHSFFCRFRMLGKTALFPRVMNLGKKYSQ